MLTSTLPSDPEVQVRFDPERESAAVFGGNPEPTSNPGAGAEAESQAAPREPEPAGAGPESAPRGRDASRRNALKEGMTAKVVFTDEMAAEVARWTVLLSRAYRPTDEFEKELIGVMGRAWAQLEYIAEQKTRDEQRCRDRAIEYWDEDRRQAVEALGERLPRSPSRLAKTLIHSKHGLEWLLGKWETLEAILEHRGEWDEPQRQFAYDLLGVEHALRQGNPIVPDGTDKEELATLVADEIAALKTLLEASLEKDEEDQMYASTGIPLDEDARTRTLRRNERDARRDYNRARSELFRLRSEAAHSHGGGTAGVAAPAASSTSAGSQPWTRTEAPVRHSPTVSPKGAGAGAGARFVAGWETILDTATPAPAEPAPANTTATTATTTSRPKAAPAAAAAANPTAPSKPLPRRVRKEMAKKARQAARKKARQAACRQAR
jgi:hypothetical protein